VKRHIPLADVIEMPGLGHVPMSDDPRAIAEAILRGAARQAARNPPVTKLESLTLKGLTPISK